MTSASSTSKAPVAAPLGFVAFEDQTLVASGDLRSIIDRVKPIAERPRHGQILVFDAETSRTVEIDFHGTVDDILARVGEDRGSHLESAAGVSRTKRGPGRPKLGVMGREVTLLPRHWEWLDEQPGGASVALRKLVEEARRQGTGRALERQAQDAAYRFMSVMAGDLAGFEEALRALYRKEYELFEAQVAAWPESIRSHVITLARRVRSAGALA